MADTIFGGGNDQWVCPNDRQLALRAKLQTGWSVHTYQTEKQRRSQSLSPAEVDAILLVIQRAERLDVLEQQRIGRLVERLETMRRNVMGNGLSQCLLCGEVLGFLGSSSVFCIDCRKKVCTKCGIEAAPGQKRPLWLCKICSEQRESLQDGICLPFLCDAAHHCRLAPTPACLFSGPCLRRTAPAPRQKRTAARHQEGCPVSWDLRPRSPQAWPAARPRRASAFPPRPFPRCWDESDSETPPVLVLLSGLEEVGGLVLQRAPQVYPAPEDPQPGRCPPLPTLARGAGRPGAQKH
nr:rab effector Noc2 isoform X2 [Dasypus novemcinctus]